MENSAVVNQTGPLCPVGSALRVPPLGYRMVKRAFDLTAALILSVLLAVPAAILMLLIRLDSPGPAIFRQERLGKNGKPFMILKLRSMRLDAEKNGPPMGGAERQPLHAFGQLSPQIPAGRTASALEYFAWRNELCGTASGKGVFL